MARARGYVETWRLRKAALAVIYLALAANTAQGIVTPRRVLHLGFEHGLPLGKSKGWFGTVIDVLAMARRAGVIPWEAVADTTERLDPPTDRDPDDCKVTTVDRAQENLLDRQAGQDCYLVAWSERRGLSRIHFPACRDCCVRLILSGGSDSLSIRYTEFEAATRRHVPTVVLHLGDRDQAGENIFKVLVEDLPRLSAGRASEVVRVALTPDQLVEFGLGDPAESVQVDALSAPRISGLLADAFEARQDSDVQRAVLEQEADERADVIDLAAA